MSDVNHTPGPWRVEADMRSENPHWENGDEIEYLAGWNIISEAGEIVGIEGIIPSDNAEANALLIASAPDLLEALKLTYAALSGVNMNMEVVESNARAAISKATGK